MSLSRYTSFIISVMLATGCQLIEPVGVYQDPSLLQYAERVQHKLDSLGETISIDISMHLVDDISEPGTFHPARIKNGAIYFERWYFNNHTSHGWSYHIEWLMLHELVHFNAWLRCRDCPIFETMALGTMADDSLIYQQAIQELNP